MGRSLAMSATSLKEGAGSGKSVRGLLDEARTVEVDDLIKSRSLVQQARVLARSNEDQPGEAEALYRLASVTYQLGQLDEAFGLALEARDLARRCAATVVEVWAYYIPSFVASKLIREISRFGGDVSSMVPDDVVKRLSEKFAK